MWWGGIRNVLCGVTTVSHHNPYAPEIFGAEFPVHVPREYGWAHSVADADRVEASLRETPACWPVVIHLAEGTDQGSAREFDALEDLVQLDERIVLVHCVGLTPSQWDRAARSGAGIVWCPSSNLFTLGRTLSAEQIAMFPSIALGSDSPISGAGDLLDEIRLAHGERGIPAPLVYDLVTARAARLLRLSAGEGSLQSGSKADLIVTRDRALTPAETLIQLTWRDVELVMEGGRIVLLSGGIADRIPNELKEGLQDVSIDGVERFVRAPVADLWFQTFAALGRMPTISGRTISIKRSHQCDVSCPSAFSSALC